jgi:preprotein translocase subunit YajC
MENFEILKFLKDYILTPKLSLSYIIYIVLLIIIVFFIYFIKQKDKKNIF